MYEFNPLNQYHGAIRETRASGYPNIQHQAPHPYEMAMAAMQRPYVGHPYRYNQGRQMRTQIRGMQPSGMRGAGSMLQSARTMRDRRLGGNPYGQVPQQNAYQHASSLGRY